MWGRDLIMAVRKNRLSAGLADECCPAVGTGLLYNLVRRFARM
jgi:hypothetical protein